MNKTMKVFVFCLTLFLSLSGHSAVLSSDIPVGDKDLIGAGIVSCFHPTASYSSIEMPDYLSTDNGTTGTVRFRGGFTGNVYYMSFTIYTRHYNGQTQLRVEPGSDSAPFPPNPACGARDWISL